VVEKTALQCVVEGVKAIGILKKQLTVSLIYIYINAVLVLSYNRINQKLDGISISFFNQIVGANNLPETLTLCNGC